MGITLAGTCLSLLFILLYVRIEQIFLSEMQKKENNYAFIDSQNLNMGIKELGWKLDWKRFRIYLKEKYSVSTAHLFI